MNYIEKKEFLEKNNEYEIFSLEYIKENLDKLMLNSIYISDGELFRINDDMVVNFMYNDYDNPVVIKKDKIWKNNILYINPKWYLENQELCQGLCEYVCSNIKQKEFMLGSSVIITKDIVKALCSNEILESVSLAPGGKNPYSLSLDDYLEFKKSKIKKVETKTVDDELKDNFDDLIVCNVDKYLISYYKYEDLCNREELNFYNDLTDEEISNLKYLSMNVKLYFNKECYKNINKVILELNRLSKNNKVVISIDNDRKEEFNKFILNNNLEYNNLFIKLNLREYPLKDYLNFEKRLYDMVSPAKNLSPFEKYIYAYNVSKKFKKYKENEEDKMSARNLYSILINDYMVCVGFSSMLGDLLTKLGIDSYDLSIGVDVSYDKEKVDEENFTDAKIVEYGGHARRYTHIVDDKYGIDGFYIGDPTWDNDLEKDLYNNLAMTTEEVLSARRFLFNNTYDSSELFFVNNIEEFIEKFKFLSNRVNKKNNFQNIISDLIFDKISKLDDTYVSSLKKKYSYLENGRYSIVWPDDISDLIYEIGNYVVEHVNKKISGEIIMEAVSAIYREVYGYDDEILNNKMIEIINDNKKRQEVSFPIRYNIKEDGTREIINNIENKFDIEYSGGKNR